MTKFDLQLFAEDGVQAVAPTPDNTTVQAEQQPTEPKYAIQDTPGGRKLVRVEESAPVQEKPAEAMTDPLETKPDKPDGTTTNEPEGGTPANEQADNGPQPYTPDEIANADDIRELDPNRIPDELKPLHKAMVAGMNKKFQEAAAEKKAAMELAEQLKRQPEQQQDPRQKFQQEFEAIKGAVEQYFGEQFDPALNPQHLILYNKLEGELRKQEQAEVETVRQQQEQQTWVNGIGEKLEQTDKAAYDYAIEQIQSKKVSAADYEAIMQALHNRDEATVNKFFNRFREAYHKKNAPASQKQKEKPPVVQTSGQGSAPKVESFDFEKAMREADTPEKKRAVITKWRKMQGG